MERTTAMDISQPAKSEPQSPKQRKSFELIRKNFAIAGITPKLVHQSYPFNGTILFSFMLLGFNICSIVIFVVYEAEQFAEYTQSINTGSIMILLILALLISIVKVKELFEFSDGGNALFDTSELEIKKFLFHRVCWKYSIIIWSLL